MWLALSRFESPLKLLVRYQPSQIAVRKPKVEELFQALVDEARVSICTLHRRMVTYFRKHSRSHLRHNRELKVQRNAVKSARALISTFI